MREILFRGKLAYGGRWAYGNLVVKSDGIAIITPDDTPVGVYGRVIPGTAGQYTGLKDKNGTRIFEGDIVYTPSFFGISEKTWVSFQNGAFGVEWPHGDGTAFQAFTSFVSSVEWEVVGNIHDNPELRGEE